MQGVYIYNVQCFVTIMARVCSDYTNPCTFTGCVGVSEAMLFDMFARHADVGGVIARFSLRGSEKGARRSFAPTLVRRTRTQHAHWSFAFTLLPALILGSVGV